MMAECKEEKLVGPERLRRNGDFREVYGTARSIADARLVLYFRSNGGARSRIGYAVGRAVGKAVTRNRIRRRLKEAVRRQAEVLPDGWDWILVARRPAATASFNDLQESLLGLVRRAVARRGNGGCGGPDKTGGKYAGRGENK